MQVVENMMVAKFEEEEGRFCVRTRAKERDLSAVDDADGCYAYVKACAVARA